MSRISEKMSENASKLLKLAGKKFHTLNKAEEKLFQEVVRGELADYSDKSEENNNPNDAKDWDKETRTIKAKVLSWLCTDTETSAMVTYKGIRVKGIRIDGELDLAYAQISFPLYFEKCAFTGRIHLRQAEIRDLYLGGTHTGPIDGDGLKVMGDIFLGNGFEAQGEVRLYGATIGGSFDCPSGQFINKNSKALIADGLNVNGSIFFNKGFKAEGEVRLYGATIRVNLDCFNGCFINHNAEALNAEICDINGSVFLSGEFKAEGKVNLVGATIDGKLDCQNGRFINPNGTALLANSLHVKNNALFNNFTGKGEFSLVDAEINGFFYWTKIASTENVRLDLRSAKVGTLRDEQESWPEKGELFLHGLVYNEIHNKAPRDIERRIDWLLRQYDDKNKKDKEQFWPQPYEQLAAVLRKSGQDEDARKILIAKNEDRARLTELNTRSEKFWYLLLGPRIGYGYRPLNALRYVFLFVVLGWFFFGLGSSGRLITPPSESAFVERSTKILDYGTKSKDLSDVHPRFNPFVYSIDTFVPLIDLHQSKYWLPNANLGTELFNIKGMALRTGGLLRLYLWIHIVMGWALTTLLVVGLTGLVRT